MYHANENGEKRREMQTKMIFWHPKWTPAAILRKKWKLRFDLKWPEMQKKCKSKMAAGGHFEQKKLKLCFDLKWWEMQTKMNFGHQKWPPAPILKKMKDVLIRNVTSVRYALSGITSGSPFFIERLSYTFLYNIQGHGTSYIYNSILFFHMI